MNAKTPKDNERAEAYQDEVEDEEVCVECGFPAGAYPDEALGKMIENKDGDPIHYGCKPNYM